MNRHDRADGGLYWATYNAVVRRDGSFTNANGQHDFNEQLTEPIIRHVAGQWEKIFCRRLAPVLSGLFSNGSTLLTKFHDEVANRAVKNGASFAAFQMLKQQIPVYKETLKDASASVKDEITTKQRDINREFVPAIKDSMPDVYSTCLIESGPGQFNRMKGHMDRHVESAKQSMFEESTAGVENQLNAMLKEVKKSLIGKTDDIFMAIKRDYTGVVVGQEAGDQTQPLPREQRSIRKAVLDIVDSAELVFKRAVGLEPEEKPKTRDDRVNEANTDDERNTTVTHLVKAEEEQTATTEAEPTDTKLRSSPQVVMEGEAYSPEPTAEGASIDFASRQPDSAEEDQLAASLSLKVILPGTSEETEAEGATKTQATSRSSASRTVDDDGISTAGETAHFEPSIPIEAPAIAVVDDAIPQEAPVSEVVAATYLKEPMADAPSDEPMVDIPVNEAKAEPVDEHAEHTSAILKIQAVAENAHAIVNSGDGAADVKDGAQAESQNWSFDFDRPQGPGLDKENDDMEADEAEDGVSTAPASSGWGFERL